MSDYLGHLITRTLAQTALVRPRLPSLFESSPMGQPLAGELEQDVFSEAQPAVPGPRRETTRAQAIVPHIESVSQQFEPATIRPAPEKKEWPSRPERPASPTDASLAPGPIRRESSDANEIHYRTENRSRSLEAAAQSSGDGGTNSKPVPVEREIAIPPISPKPAVTEQGPTQIERSSPDRLAREAETAGAQLPTRDLPAELPEGIKPALETTRPAGPVVPVIRGVPPIVSKPAPAPEPTIKVTIGRVEIRAVNAPERPRAEPKSSKILSLDDYLRQRAKKGGR